VLKSLDNAASSLRAKLGESLSSVQQYAIPLEQATTSSLDALKEYSLGEADHLRTDDDQAIPHLKRAIELDPNLAMAYTVLGVCYNNLAEPNRSFELLKKAYDLRERASERERFYIQAHYYGYATGEIEKEDEVDEQWNHTYPRDSTPLDNLALNDRGLGLPEKAIAAASEAMGVDRKDFYAYSNLAHRVAFLRGDQDALQREVSWAAGKTREPFILYMKYNSELVMGRVKTSRESRQVAIASANHNGIGGFVSVIEIHTALGDAAFGLSDAARKEANEALRSSREKETRQLAALALARESATPRRPKRSWTKWAAISRKTCSCSPSLFLR